MKKLVTPGFKGSALTCLLLLATSVFLGISSGLLAQQGCVISCLPMDPPLDIPLSSACEDVLTYDNLGVEVFNCPGEITVDILVNGVSIGPRHPAVVRHPSDGSSVCAAAA